MFAVRYPVDGVETFSTGYTTASAFNFNTRASAGSVFDRFAIGTTHPCWYDPQDTRTVVLVRGPGGAYIFALLPIPVLLIGMSVLRGLAPPQAECHPRCGHHASQKRSALAADIRRAAHRVTVRPVWRA